MSDDSKNEYAVGDMVLALVMENANFVELSPPMIETRCLIEDVVVAGNGKKEYLILQLDRKNDSNTEVRSAISEHSIIQKLDVELYKKAKIKR